LQQRQVVYAKPKQDIGAIWRVGGIDAPHRVRTYFHGFSDLFDPDIHRIYRVGRSPTRITNDPSIERMEYEHNVAEISTGNIVGKVTTRSWRSPGSGGTQWALMRIIYQDTVVYLMEGA
jgi:hypothetical protein